MDVASALGWPPSRQTIFEQASVTHIHDRLLTALARELNFPEEFFTAPPSPPLPPEDILFRAPAATTKREKAYLAEFARIAGDVLFWLDSYSKLPPVKLPTVTPGTSVAEAARLTREAMGVEPDRPIGHLTHQMERSGIPIIVRGTSNTALPEKHLGYSTRVGHHRERPLSVLQAQESWERTRWTLAHEAGHLVLHGSLLPENAEEQAHDFAGQLLAPVEVIRGELPRFVTLAGLTEIKLRWGLSIGSLIQHLSRHGLISDERKETLRRQLYTRINPDTGRTWGRDEPGWNLREVERPSLITHWMRRSIGGSAPNLVAALSKTWPADIIAMMTSHQRTVGEQAEAVPARAAGRPAGSSKTWQRSGHDTADVIDIRAFRPHS